MVAFKKKGFNAYLKEQQKIDIDNVVNVINLHHGTDEGTRYVRQWEAYKCRKAEGCANINCENHQSYDALQGAHVKLADGDDDHWYITPLCHSCNSDANNDKMVVYKEDLALYNDIKDIPV